MRRLVRPSLGVSLLLWTVSCSTNPSGLQGGGSGGLGGVGMAGAGGGPTSGAGGSPGGSGGTTAGTGGGPDGGGAGGQAASGSSCATAADCLSGICVDGICCQTACSGLCRSCANSTGTCTMVPNGMDPHDDCRATNPAQCGASGLGCDGDGKCILWPAGTACGGTAACDSTASSVLLGSVCNGQGNCLPAAPVSCNGFVCAAGACGTDCVDDSGCLAGGFCSAEACVTHPNLAGNGDLETGTLTGWSAFQGGTLSLSSSDVHAGQYAVEMADRTASYTGPGYFVPTGLGQYTVSFWAMQNQDSGTSSDGLLQLRLTCANGDSYYLGNVALPLPQGVWVNFSATLDTATDPLVGPDCFPDGLSTGELAGLVRSAEVLVAQDQSQPSPDPALYVDDLVVQVTDGHNLVGNPNFEAGDVDGWATNDVGTALLTVSGTYANSGTRSLQEASRSLPGSGIRYALPIGAARYAVAFNVMQLGSASHPLQLQAAYSCIGDTSVRTPTDTIVTTDALAPGVFVPLTGTFTFPPADAPAGCQLSTAAVWVTQAETGTCSSIGECPDLFLDDAAITLAD